MPTFSTNLALTLIGTGEQSGTWGTTTNTNLGTLLEQAISGYQTQACTGGTDTITIPDGADGVARNMFLELTGTGGGTLVVPAKRKLYFIYNNTSTAITVKVTLLTGVSVPAAAKVILVNNGTDIFVATNYMPSLTLGAALPIASGGTAGTTASAARAALSAAVLGANGDITSLTGLTTPLSVAQGGTGSASVTAYAAVVGNSGGTGFSSVAPGTSGNLLTSNGTSWASTAPSVVSSFSAGTTGFTPSTGTTGAVTLAGTLAVANGGTASTTAAGARSALSAAVLGANGDITSLTGLTTPLSVAQGGTGATTAAGARTALSAAGSGAVGSSDLTMTTARVLGRTTASTGAIEEITVGAGLTLSSGSLVSPVKAWITYNGSTDTVLASYNMGTPTKNGTGNYSFTFTNALSSANYAMTFGGLVWTNANQSAIASIFNGTTPTTAGFQIETNSVGGAVAQSRADVTRLCIVCFE